METQQETVLTSNVQVKSLGIISSRREFYVDEQANKLFDTIVNITSRMSVDEPTLDITWEKPSKREKNVESQVEKMVLDRVIDRFNQHNVGATITRHEIRVDVEHTMHLDDALNVKLSNTLTLDMYRCVKLFWSCMPGMFVDRTTGGLLRGLPKIYPGTDNEWFEGLLREIEECNAIVGKCNTVYVNSDMLKFVEASTFYRGAFDGLKRGTLLDKYDVIVDDNLVDRIIVARTSQGKRYYGEIVVVK